MREQLQNYVVPKIESDNNEALKRLAAKEKDMHEQLETARRQIRQEMLASLSYMTERLELSLDDEQMARLNDYLRESKVLKTDFT